MTCPPDNLGLTCPLPMFPAPGTTWTCSDCNTTWTADTFWRTK